MARLWSAGAGRGRSRGTPPDGARALCRRSHSGRSRSASRGSLRARAALEVAASSDLARRTRGCRVKRRSRAKRAAFSAFNAFPRTPFAVTGVPFAVTGLLVRRFPLGTAKRVRRNREGCDVAVAGSASAPVDLQPARVLEPHDRLLDSAIGDRRALGDRLLRRPRKPVAVQVRREHERNRLRCAVEVAVANSVAPDTADRLPARRHAASLRTDARRSSCMCIRTTASAKPTHAARRATAHVRPPNPAHAQHPRRSRRRQRDEGRPRTGSRSSPPAARTGESRRPWRYDRRQTIRSGEALWRRSSSFMGLCRRPAGSDRGRHGRPAAETATAARLGPARGRRRESRGTGSASTRRTARTLLRRSGAAPATSVPNRKIHAHAVSWRQCRRPRRLKIGR